MLHGCLRVDDYSKHGTRIVCMRAPEPAGGVRSGPRKAVALYAVLKRSQVAWLRDVRGGDEARIAALQQLGCCKLVGRPGLDPRCSEIAQELLR